MFYSDFLFFELSIKVKTVNKVILKLPIFHLC